MVGVVGVVIIIIRVLHHSHSVLTLWLFLTLLYYFSLCLDSLVILFLYRGIYVYIEILAVYVCLGEQVCGICLACSVQDIQ